MRTLKIGIGYKEDIAIFHMKGITLAEEAKLNAAFADIRSLEGETKTARELEILTDFAVTWSTREPTKLVLNTKTGKKDEVSYYPNKDKDAAIREYFAREGEDNYRLANKLIVSLQGQMEPTVVFY